MRALDDKRIRGMGFVFVACKCLMFVQIGLGWV